MKIDVALGERVLIHVNGRPRAYLGPGRHRVRVLFAKAKVVRLRTADLLASLSGEELALVPETDLVVLTVGVGERVLVTRAGRPMTWLSTGEHQVWTADRALDRGPSEARPRACLVRFERFDCTGVAVTPLREEVRQIVPAGDYVEATAPQGSVALRYVDGMLDAVLPPGRHAAWTVSRKVTLAVIDLRERVLHVAGQEVMTKDRVTLRMNLSATFSVEDAARLATVARTPDDVLYLAMQMAAREAIARVTLDELLASRDVLAGSIAAEVSARATSVGLGLRTFGLRDVILPGEMKALLNRVIAAQKEAEANVILRREETAATRSMAQTARVLAENPLLVRLKELEAYKDLAGKVGQVHLVLGDGALEKLQLRT